MVAIIVIIYVALYNYPTNFKWSKCLYEKAKIHCGSYENILTVYSPNSLRNQFIGGDYTCKNQPAVIHPFTVNETCTCNPYLSETEKGMCIQNE